MTNYLTETISPPPSTEVTKENNVSSSYTVNVQ